MKRLENKVAVITGGNSGIGLATAQEFIAQGARVIITGRNEQANKEALLRLGENAYAVVSDAGKMQDIVKLAQQVEELAGHIDILFANAGIARYAPVTAIDEYFYDETFDINVKGVFFTIQKLLPVMNDGGAIIMNSSVVASIGMLNSNIYAASKAAVRSLAKTLSNELLSRNIRVNTISPGPINTPLYSPDKMGMTSGQIEQLAQNILHNTPMKRFGSPEEIAKVAVFLASADSSFIIGEEIIVDGGMITL
jgi:NAD(P)-dependent dehydrogenase (short-subunit alcohol dehydrogenase family)